MCVLPRKHNNCVIKSYLHMDRRGAFNLGITARPNEDNTFFDHLVVSRKLGELAAKIR